MINTGTTIVTFLMVFLIQYTQNRDAEATQVKLDELIRVSTAHNSFVEIEHLTDDELEEIRNKCEMRAGAKRRARSQSRTSRPKGPPGRGTGRRLGGRDENRFILLKPTFHDNGEHRIHSPAREGR